MQLQIEAFQHDLDGNLTQDGTFKYSWDAENRLIGVDPVTPTVSGVRVRFDYDYMGRRARKQVFTGGWCRSKLRSVAAS